MHFETTSGLILDPFSIHATGVIRAHYQPKTSQAKEMEQFFGPLHGEKAFKQAFVNCCHFAETMTVVGPVAQVAWDLSSPAGAENALRWKLRGIGENAKLFQMWEGVMRSSKWNRIEKERWWVDNQYALNVMPDFTFKSPTGKTFRNEGDYRDAKDRIVQFMFGESGFSRAAIRTKVKEAFTPKNLDPRVISGHPTLGLMAVVFTFKKPSGEFQAHELNNLATWPPMVFFIPTLVPAKTSLERFAGYGALAGRYMLQPAMHTYRLTFQTKAGTIIPYGQPYQLQSVDAQGKIPDTLRSLSDVFKALWSQATQWSAWNTKFFCDNDFSEIQDVVDLSLEPMGAGRRIRGHNRFINKFDVDNVQFLWEPMGLNRAESEMDLVRSGRAVDKICYRNQLRSNVSNQWETIFCLPSYFDSSMVNHLQPLAITMFRYLMIGRTFNDSPGLESFLDGRVVERTTPFSPDGSINIETGNEKESFLGRAMRAMNMEDEANNGALPVHRVKGDVVFSPEGMPRVFGLKYPKAQQALGRDRELDDAAFKDQILDRFTRLDNFKYIEQICSGTTRDLTDAFDKVRESSLKNPESKGASLLDKTLAIDMFDDSEMM